MKKLTFSIVGCLVLAALMIGPVAAGAGLKADLDGDGDLEEVLQWNSPTGTEWRFRVSDLDKDGDPDLVETPALPVLTCNLDNDAMPEAVIQDGSLDTPWAGYAVGSDEAQIALIFIRGQVGACVQNPGAEDMVLYVTDGAYVGSADVDGDGKAEIIWIVPAVGAGATKDRSPAKMFSPLARKPVTQ